jgi:hypothetical protein
MRRIVVSAIGAALLCAPAIMRAQSTGATYITREEVDTVNTQTGVDRTIRVVDIGHENFAVGIIHRGPTGGGPGAAAEGGAAGGRAGAAAGGPAGRGAGAAVAEACGQAASTPPPAGTASFTSRRPRAITSSRAPGRWSLVDASSTAGNPPLTPR